MLDWLTINIDFFFLFIIYSFIGWILESAYKTIVGRHGFINSGFLHNPFVPIYGFGAIIMILLDNFIGTIFFPVKILLFTLVCLVLEYLTSLLFEKVFNVKLWDYSNKALNIHGRICLLNSLFWLVLIIAFLKFIRPAVDVFILAKITPVGKFYITFTLLCVIIIDTVISALELKSVAGFINTFFTKFKSYNAELKSRVSNKIKGRLFRIFPNLEKTYNQNLQNGLLSLIKARTADSNIANALRIIRNPSPKKEDMNAEYLREVEDLLDHEDIRRIKASEHYSDTLFSYCCSVSQVSFYLARNFNLDARSAARGALLRDLLLCGLRDNDKYVKKSSVMALKNAGKIFGLNEIEEDIIQKHMWPLTRKFFKYKESFLVSMVYKTVSVRGGVKRLNGPIKGKINKKKR